MSVEDLLADPENKEWSSISLEFCRGTHITNTREAKAFALLSKDGIAKGVFEDDASKPEMSLLEKASLGESKNKAESVSLYMNANGKKLVLGTLSHQNCPQLSFDLVFDQEFELSYNWKNGSVYFLGYKTYIPEEGIDDFVMRRSFLWLLLKMGFRIVDREVVDWGREVEEQNM
ncbi:hypothetical protein V6N13_038153 [Hibiscus sabdariffa]|uniref:Threonyl/alanyl tRNA synthetase SAD domain-containing protein n=1 Tax=Hibiscus sabdariffa TaxID=183260 RepID=A0ABR2S307_9ROSI